MIYRHLLSIVCVLFAGILAAYGQNNSITIPDVSIAKGKTISLPIYMDNTSDVVAVQFTLTVPDGISLTTESATLSERSDGHSVVFKNLDANKYMAMIFSSTNNAIRGRTGELMSVFLMASSNLEEGVELPLTMTDVIIGARDGSNLTTSFDAGIITIATSPDLEVSQVWTPETMVTPGGKITLNWTVTNIGGLPTSAGWSEQIYLKSNQGASKLMGTLYYDEPLGTGAVVSRNAEINVPSVLGMDGNCNIVVKIIPNSNAGEPSWLQDNNIAAADNTLDVIKTLLISPENAYIDESDTKDVRFQLTRSGDVAKEEIFALSRSGDDRINLPKSVKIEKGNSSVYFYAQVTANNILDNDSSVNLAVSGNDYPEISSTINIEDDTYPSLSIEVDKDEVVEGETIKFTITAERAPKQDLEIKFASDYPNRFVIPSITLPGGSMKVEAMVDAKDDDVPDVTQYVTFTASAAGYNKATGLIDLLDNDVPSLQLSLSPDAISEGAGTLSIVATLKRTDNIDKAITIRLSDDSNDNIYYGNQIIEMAAGVEEVNVKLGPIDNSVVEGERTYNITAAVWIASCSCSASGATSGGEVTAPLTVFDNDGPTLSASASSSVLKEGESLVVTVGRNTGSISVLSINVTSNNDARLDYPATVTIPEGESTVSFEVKSIKDDSNQGDVNVMLTVECEGYSKDNVWFIVSDQTLPDAQISSLELDLHEIEIGQQLTVTATIKNTGFCELPELTTIGFYKDEDRFPLAITYLQAPLPPGESASVVKRLELPDAVGEYKLYAIVNDGKSIKELLYTNNSSNFADVRVISPFSVTLQTDKDLYKPNEPVEITGAITGRNNENHDIDIYLINNYRQTLQVKTDEHGNFATTWNPTSRQGGHYVIGACYPGEKADIELCSIDILGLNLEIESKGIESAASEEYNGRFTIVNPGNLPVDNVVCRILSNHESCEISLEDNGAVGTVAPGSSVSVGYSIKGIKPSEGSDYEQIQLMIGNDDGIEAGGVLYYYCHPRYGKIEAETTLIDCTVSKNTPRDIPVVITNRGKGATGPISLSIATPWIENMTPMEMASLQHGDSATIVLRLIPDNLQLNVIQTAKVGINCASGEGTMLNIVMEPVSEETGHLTVDVRDQFTYNTTEAPHLSGASIQILHPINKTIVASGTTNKDGIFETDLPEGYYTLNVRADEHESYSNNILVNAGRTNIKNIDLSYTGGISITYTVEPVEGGIADQYRIVTTVEFETNVPVPVVVLDGPTSIDAEAMRPGESVILNYVATNKGLVTALDYHIVLPEASEDFSMTPLYDPAPRDIPANTSVAYPILFTRNPYFNRPQKILANAPGDDIIDNFNTCMTGLEQWYKDRCGTELRNNHGAVMLALKACAYGAIAGAIMDRIPSIGIPTLGGGPGGNGGGPGSGGTNYVGISQERSICNPDVAEAANDGINLILGAGLGPIAGAVNNGMDLAIETSVDGHPSLPTVLGVCIDALTPFTSDGFQLISQAALRIGQGAAFLLNHGDVMNVISRHANNKKRNLPDWMVYFGGVADQMHKQMEAVVDIQDQLFGDHYWIDHYDETMLPFVNELIKLNPAELMTADLALYKPESVTLEMMQTLVERCYNISNGIEGSNTPDYHKIINAGNILRETEDYAKDNGYESMEEIYRMEYGKYMKLFNEESSSVCSSVSLQFEQKLVMTREAFRGLLTVYNGHDRDAMSDIVLNLTVTDKYGTHVTDHEMTIALETVSDFVNSASESNWTLASKQTGKATVLYIPTKYAAPQTPTEYIFGGSLTYTNPYNGLSVTETFIPVILTVHPSPNLDLTYFMQRDVFGDDPMTEIVEPSEEAEFSLLINNIGYGDATNVKMTTEQPKIIDNEKGLMVNFELLSSLLNGKEKTLALGSSATTDFGTIPAKSTSYAQWMFNSPLLGHFTDYNVETTHITSYGNPDLSLLNEVSIHELIRSIDVNNGTETLKGFMTNDIVDSDDTPDMLYLSNGEVHPVSIVASADISRTSENQYTVIITSKNDGWNYGYILDPTYGVAKLKNVIRQSDGQEISLRNFWQTDRTLRDGKDPVYDNRIHFVDRFNASSAESYTLSFEPMPALTLEVISIEGMPSDGSIVRSPINQIKVVFNKYIDAKTFSIDDIELSIQGTKQNLELVDISTEDNKTFTLDFSEFNKTAGNGFYVLSIQTSSISDVEGFVGAAGKQVSWTQYVDGKVKLITTAIPAEGGTVTPQTGLYDYESSITLKATPADGYKFLGWWCGDVQISDTAETTVTLIDDKVYSARFALKQFRISVDCNSDGGFVDGTATGIYDFGHTARMEAVPNYGWTFSHWTVDGVDITDNVNTLDLTVDHDTEVYATFVSHIKEFAIPLQRGWNWISSVFDDKSIHNPMEFFKSIKPYLAEVRANCGNLILNDGIFDGSIERMIPGTYKIKVNNSTSLRLKGATVFEDDYVVNLAQGWNWIPYIPVNEINITDALANLSAQENDVLKSHTQFAVFSDGRWHGSLKSFVPGEGYMYYASVPASFKFPSSVVAGLNVTNSNNTPWQCDERGFADNKTIVANISDNGTPVGGDNYIVGAFCGDECRGIGEYIEGAYFITVHGQQGDDISFKVIDNQSGEARKVKESLSFDENPLGSILTPYGLSLEESLGINDALVGYGLNITPNPVNDIMYIVGDLSNVKSVKVIATSGLTLISTDSFEYGVNVTKLVDGAYVAAIVTTNGVVYKKFLKNGY